MLEFKQDHIQVGKQVNREKMPFKFEVKSKFPKSVYIETRPICGCTVMRSKFEVKPNEEFNIEGFLNKRPRTGLYTKQINIFAYNSNNKNRKQLFSKTVKFTIDVI